MSDAGVLNGSRFLGRRTGRVHVEHDLVNCHPFVQVMLQTMVVLRLIWIGCSCW